MNRRPARLIGGRDAPLSLRLKLVDLLLEVRSNSPELIAALADYFRSFIDRGPEPTQATVTALETDPQEVGRPLTIKDPEPGKTKIKEEYADLDHCRLVRKRLTGMIFLFGGETNLAVGALPGQRQPGDQFINNRLIQHYLAQGGLLAHAAAAARDGRGLAAAGFSGMGKSTLALWMTSRGMDFISNDRLIIKPTETGVRMFGVAKQPRINPGTALANPDLAGVVSEADRAAFSDLPADELWALEHKYDAVIEDCYGPDRFSLTAAMDGLAILNWRRDGGPCRVRRVDLEMRRDLLAAFKKEPACSTCPRTRRLKPRP